MKLKGVNPLEQHIEKIVLVAVAVIFLAVVAAQFLLQPNKVSVGSQPPVPPGRAFEAVRVKAEAVRGRMNAADPDLPEPPTVNLVDQFMARREAPVAPSPTLAQLGRRPQIDQVAGPQLPTGTDRIAEVSVPAPVQLVGYSPRGAVSPGEVQQSPALRDLLPAAQPFDKAGVSVEARFSGRQLREALLAPGEEGTKPMPQTWWRDAVEVFTIRMEREELTETGEWTNLTTVPPIPGRFDMMEQVREATTAAELTQIASDARAYSTEILRPDYLRMIAGAPWLPPSEAARLQPLVNNPEIERKLAAKKGLENQRTGLQAQLDELGGGEGGGAAPPGGGGARAPGGGGRGEQPPRTGDEQRRRQQLERAIKNLDNRIAQIDAELAQLGYIAKPEEDPTAAQQPGETRIRPLLEQDSIQLWAHDITAEPGKTYRYRIAVGVSNPFFGRAAGLVPEQQQLAADTVLMSQWSEWSEPISVLSDEYYFITSAHEGDQLAGPRAPPRARAEVFRFFYGFYRKGEIGQLEPGDQIVAQVKLPDAKLLPIYELPELANANPGAEEPGNPGAGRGLQVGGPGDPVGGENQGLKSEPWSQPVVARINSFLLDVASLPGQPRAGGRAPTVAYLRGENGVIVAHTPIGEEQDSVFRRVAQSARDGENQGEPIEIEAPKPLPDRPGPRRPDDDPPPPPDGGGGAGGG